MPINGHSRKGSLLVGGEGIDIKKGPLAFGSVDSPNPLLSSSPAAPSLIGGHLSNSVQSFGSLPADTSSAPAPTKRNNMTTAPAQPAAKKPLDPHMFFTKKSTPATQNQQSQSSQSSQQPQQPHPSQQAQQPQHPQSTQSHITSPPPSMNGHPMAPNHGQFRPSSSQSMMQQGQQMRQNGAPFVPRPMGMGQGMPQYAQQHHGMPYGYPQQQYQQYPGFDPQQQQYSQWQSQQQHHQQQQQHPQHQQQQRGPPPTFMSPRGSASGLPQAQPSPAPPSAQLPNGSVSPAPSPMNRPNYMGPSPSGSGPSMSGVPSRPMSQGPSNIFIPGQQSQQGSLQPTVPAFSPAPRPRAALKIMRPDGTAVDLAAAAPAKSNGTTPEPVAPAAAAAPVVPKKTGPVKMESEEQRKARLAEEAQKEKTKKDGEVSEQEAKDKKEREAKEAEEKRVAEEAKAKEEAEAKKAKEAAAEEQRKKDEASAAEEAAAKKRSEEEAAAKAAKEESDKAAEAQRKAASTPEPSATDSASASPNPAGLPAKPTATARRPVPAALDLLPSTPKPANPSPTAMLTAKPITDLSTINYQAPIQSPSADLNKDAQPGKFRYDRDFLMQFMVLCMEKPDRLPPLEEIGLEADTSSSGFGKRGGRPSSGAGYPRTASGAGGSGSGGPRHASGGGMGTFGTGNFGSIGSGTRGTTSDSRYQQSLATRGAHSNRGTTRTGRPPSGPGQPRQPRHGGSNAPTPFEPPVAPLVTSENSWVNQRPGKEAEDTKSPTYVARKVKGLLNKLTEEKFDSISGKILDFANISVEETNGQSLKLVIKLIFEKATDEAHWSAMYAKLCRKMLDEVDPRVTEIIDDKEVAGGVLFRKYLIGRCQQDFESGWKERENAALKAQQKQEDDKQTLANHAAGGESAEPAVLSDEYYAAQKAKRRGLGLVQLIGELFKMDMVNKNVMKQCFLKLLGNVDETDEEDIESACKLLTTIGSYYDSQSSENVQGIMNRLEAIREKGQVSSRVQFMIMDLFDLRAARWKGAKATTSVMTIAEIHQQAAKEQAQKSAATQQSMSNMSRPGSRPGQPRNGPGDWQTTPSQAPRQRPTDFSHMGRLNSTNAAPSFQPQSAFGKNRKGGASASTPPISRQPSQANIAVTNANPFALLHDSNEAAESSEAAPQRKKLNLAPRTKPVSGDEAEGEGEGDGEGEGRQSEESDDEVTTPVQSSMMTETAALAKIKLDMSELWGDKNSGGSRNPDDIVHYFRALPEPRRPLLATQLYEDVFRLAKLKDAQVIAKGLSAAVDEGVATKDSLTTGLETRIVTLDDESIDFPAAYKAVACIIRSLSFSTEEVDSIAGKISVYGEPKITPKMKLDRALAQVDEEAKEAAQA